MDAENIFTSRNKVILIMILLAAMVRIIPVEYRMTNFASLGAIALFCGAFINNKKHALILTVVVMLFTDILLQVTGQQGFNLLMPWVYSSVIVITFIGRLIRKLQSGYSSIVLTMVAPLFSSIIFFFITNFGVWVNGDLHSLSALAHCYIDAIPFYKGTVLGDVFFTTLLFGCFSIIKWRYPVVAVN